MRSLSVFLLLSAAFLTASAADNTAFNAFFTDRTLRIDYFHAGSKGTESYSLDEAVLEGPWPGSRVNLVDTLNLGEYLVRVYDQQSGRLIFSRGFSTIFNEWQTTDEAAQGLFRTFSESVRFPLPKRAVQASIARRDKRMVFHELFSLVIDPSDPNQIRKEEKEKAIPRLRVTPILDNGAPAEKVDIVILGDGYSPKDLLKLETDAKHFTDVLFSTPPFKERKKDFNVRLIESVSGESGIDIPDKDVWKNNVLGARYNTFGSARYVLTTENKTVRTIAALVPYDFICILINDTRYGGGGIYNLYATTYTMETTQGQQWQMDYVYVHEFGHSFAGLGDEYYSSSVAYSDFYQPGIEPWEPNVTALTERKNLKWKSFVSEGVEIPTPWEKTAYDSVEALRAKLDRLAPDYYQKREPLYKKGMEILATSRSAGKVGAFEGAGYASKGLYRPAVDCRMFSLSLVGFDPVCSAAIGRMIDFYSK